MLKEKKTYLLTVFRETKRNETNLIDKEITVHRVGDTTKICSFSWKPVLARCLVSHDTDNSRLVIDETSASQTISLGAPLLKIILLDKAKTGLQTRQEIIPSLRKLFSLDALFRKIPTAADW